MKNINHFGVILILSVYINACSLFEYKEKKAIEICQKSKVQFETDNPLASLLLNLYGNSSGLSENATWLDFANMIAKEEPNKKYEWKARETEVKNIFLVSFVDQSNWGHNWEVDIEQQIVKSVNQNDYLSRKYGFSRFDADSSFQITKITIDTLKLEKDFDKIYYNTIEGVTYTLKGSIKNNTGKPLTSSNLSGMLKLIFKDKTIEGKSKWDSGFKSTISKSKPWNPNTERDFTIKTKAIEKIYLEYEPEYVFIEINLKAEDPIGYTFNKAIEEYDLKIRWKSIKNEILKVKN